MSFETYRRLSDNLMHIAQAVGDKLDYSFDWADWLNDGESISTSSWSVAPGVTSSAPGIAGEQTVVWLESPATGAFSVTNTIVTSTGRKVVRSFVLDVKAKLS